MYKVTVNNKWNYIIRFDKESNKNIINDLPFEWDLIETKKNCFHIIKDYKTYTVEILKADYSAKHITLRVNNNIYSIVVKDSFDELLHKLGLDNLNVTKINAVKAPMPGLVLNVIVEEGQRIQKDEPLIVLEAMKMENVLKSPCEGIIKKINVVKGKAVEKNEVLINIE